MGVGGAEIWIRDVLRHIDRDRFRFRFLVHLDRPGELDDELRDLGATIHVVSGHRQPLRYARALRQLLRALAPDIVHSHVGFFSGWTLSLARALGVPGRIAHSHSSPPPARGSLPRMAYERGMRAAIHASASRGLGASAQACAALYGPGWRARGKYEVLLSGYDFGRFAAVDASARADCRRALGLGPDDLVIGHIGRFVREKNHAFLVELAAAAAARDRARGRRADRFVLVGDGPLRPEIEAQIARAGLHDRFVLTGQRTDIPWLLAGFDLLLLPSLWEGLGLVAVEAQAAGVKCLVGHTVPDEAMVLPRGVIKRPVGDVGAWLDALDELRACPAMPPAEALAAMQASRFGMAQHIARLTDIYSTICR